MKASRTPNRALCLTATVVVLALVATALPAAARSAELRSDTSTPSPSGRTVVVGDVTLLTGHKVRVTRGPDGKQAATVEAPPGRDGNVFAFTDKAGDLHVVPRQALPLLQANRLDGRLFNLTDLIEQGYDDRHRAAIPLIVSYPRATTPAAVTRNARKLSGTARAFPSADAVALQVTKSASAGFWTTVTTTQSARAGGRSAAAGGPAYLKDGAAKVWLDGKVRADLEQSVSLIGAPQAWSAGYDGKDVTVAVLDTGYDPAHPDLTGKVVGERDFDGTGTVVDGNGHGTHVAATVAGTGSASDGRRKGVAPGAKLLIGKVLDNDGSGDESWVLAGMEWAAAGGAKVISMSLGGGPSDGTDPLSQAVDSLTASTGALFVIAAGNAGPYEGTVSTPGAADTALTVGNTDKQDQLNETSSRGPRPGDHAVKPEITAPGTDIIAARAAGTSLGDPVDSYYTSLSGTSMATPHVAGAAAILAQRHPDWTPAQLKSALTGTAKAPAAGTVFEHGAGRLDVTRAVAATVTASESTLSFGFVPWPGTGSGPVTRTVAYSNSGSSPVTLDLSLDASYTTGEALPSGAAVLSSQQVVVPASSSVSVTVTVDPAKVHSGDVSGMLVAQGNGQQVRTPWSYAEEDERYDLTIAATGKNGKPSAGWAMVWSAAMGFYYYGVRLDGTGPQSIRLPKDDYMVIGGSTVYGANDTILEETVGGTPQLSLTKDSTVTIDARKGQPLRFDTPRQSRAAQVQLGWMRWFSDGHMDGRLAYSGTVPKLSLAPSNSVSTGDFEFVAGGRLVAPTATTGRTPYLYDLLIPTAGRIPSGTFKVRDLARIDSTFAGVGVDGRRTKEVRSGFSARTNLDVRGVSDVFSGGPRTDYVSANGSEWESMVRLPQAGDEDVPTMWDNYRSYPSGARLQTRWWGAPYTVGTDSDYSITDAYRRENRLSILLRDYQDGEADHWGDSYWNEHPTQSVRSRIYRDGVLLKDVARGNLDVDDLPPGEATYRFVHSITRRGPIWTSSSYSESDWTFRSAYESDTGWPPKAIPMLDLNWTVPTDVRNTAPRLSPFVIGLQARHVRGLTAGSLLPARMSVSYDDGRRWRSVPLIRTGKDRYAGILLHPPVKGWVSLRGEIKDTAGGTLRQTTLRAYALR